MKKFVLSVVIASMTLSLVGCGTKSNAELEKVNKKLEDSYATIDKLEEKVDELSDKINSSGDIKLQAYTGKGQDIAAQISHMGYVYNLDDYEKLVESVKEKAKAEGKTVIAKEKMEGETVFVIRTTETIKDITLNSLGDRFGSDFGHVDNYIKECGIENKGNLISELKPDEILIFNTHETEGLPTNYFSWTEPDGTTIYNAVSYHGSGEFY